LATSHGGQGSNRLSGTLSEKGTTSATGGGFCFDFPQMQKSEYAEHIRFFSIKPVG
jgi:hypothetical protein